MCSYKRTNAIFFSSESKHETPLDKCPTCAKLKRKCVHRSTIHAIQSPVTYSFILINDDSKEIVFKQVYTGDDCIEHLLNYLLDIEDQILKALQRFPVFDKKIMTAKDWKRHKTEKNCHICESPFYKEERVPDHCHATNKYRGPAHFDCNFQLREENRVVIFAHGLSCYDGHFLMQKIGEIGRISQIRALPKNAERFRTLSFASYVSYKYWTRYIICTNYFLL